MYTDNEDEGKLLCGDLVFTRNGEGLVNKLIVTKELSLENMDDIVQVKDELSWPRNVSVSNLLKEKGFIFIIPSTLYTFQNKSIELNEIASQILMSVLAASALRYILMRKWLCFLKANNQAKTR